MSIPENVLYSEEHEWVRVDGNQVTIGITDHAQGELGDVVYVELPEEEEEIHKGDTFGVVESTKAVSDIYAPVSGTIIEINEAVVDEPEAINKDPYGEGWLVKVELSDDSELEALKSNEEYEAFIEE